MKTIIDWLHPSPEWSRRRPHAKGTYEGDHTPPSLTRSRTATRDSEKLLDLYDLIWSKTIKTMYNWDYIYQGDLARGQKANTAILWERKMIFILSKGDLFMLISIFLKRKEGSFPEPEGSLSKFLITVVFEQKKISSSRCFLHLHNLLADNVKFLFDSLSCLVFLNSFIVYDIFLMLLYGISHSVHQISFRGIRSFLVQRQHYRISAHFLVRWLVCNGSCVLTLSAVGFWWRNMPGRRIRLANNI